jgi:hypothetical protein
MEGPHVCEGMAKGAQIVLKGFTACDHHKGGSLIPGPARFKGQF